MCICRLVFVVLPACLSENEPPDSAQAVSGLVPADVEHVRTRGGNHSRAQHNPAAVPAAALVRGMCVVGVTCVEFGCVDVSLIHAIVCWLIQGSPCTMTHRLRCNPEACLYPLTHRARESLLSLTCPYATAGGPRRSRSRENSLNQSFVSDSVPMEPGEQRSTV